VPRAAGLVGRKSSLQDERTYRSGQCSLSRAGERCRTLTESQQCDSQSKQRGCSLYSIRVAVRLVSSASMRTSTYRATSERSAALGLRDCESKGSRTGSRFNCTKTGKSMSGSTKPTTV
jgi:hypothetical protein